MNATREHVGMPPLDPQLIFSYVGNGASVLVRRALGPDAPDELVGRALTFFLQFYRKHALQHTQLYAGVGDAVKKLASDGHRLAILTNKPVRISTDIVRALGMADLFKTVYGGDSFSQKKPDPIGIHRLRNEAKAAANETLMIGDSGVDIQTARNAGVPSCGVAWGFQPEGFETVPPDYLIHEPNELVELIGRQFAAV